MTAKAIKSKMLKELSVYCRPDCGCADVLRIIDHLDAMSLINFSRELRVSKRFTPSPTRNLRRKSKASMTLKFFSNADGCTSGNMCFVPSIIPVMYFFKIEVRYSWKSCFRIKSVTMFT